MHTRQGVAEPAQPDHNSARKWAPLEKLCPPGLCEQFMFMGSADGIYLYKHVDSRRYLNVDAHGRTYAFNSQSRLYYEIPVTAAMRMLAVGDYLESLFAPSERAAIAILIGRVRS